MLNGEMIWTVDDNFMGYPWTLAGETILHQDEFLKGSFLDARTGKRVLQRTFYPLGSTLDALAPMDNSFAVATNAQRLYIGKPGFPPTLDIALTDACYNLLPYESHLLCHLKNSQEVVAVNAEDGHTVWQQNLLLRDIILVGFDTLVIGLAKDSLHPLNPITGHLGTVLDVKVNWAFGIHQWKQHLVFMEGRELCLLCNFFPPARDSCLLTTEQQSKQTSVKMKQFRAHSYRQRSH